MLVLSVAEAFGNEELRSLFKVTPEIHPRIQRQVILDLMNDSTDSISKKFNERNFSKALADIGDERGKIIFGQNWGNIKELAGVLEKINGPSGLAGGGSGAAFQNISTLKSFLSMASGAGLGGLLGHAGGAGRDILGAMAGAAAGKVLSFGSDLVGYRALANLMINPKLTANLLKALQATSRVAPYAVDATVNEVGSKNPLDNVKQKAKELQDQFHKTGIAPAPAPEPTPQPTAQHNRLGLIRMNENGDQIVPIQIIPGSSAQTRKS